MTRWFQDLLRASPVITDGAWGTQLQERGLPLGACPDAWNLTHPEAVEGVARSYVAAGSRVILTNTFGANRFALERHGLAGKVREINHAGAAISRAAAGAAARVFASMGPTGRKVVEGGLREGEARAAFHEQALALVAGGADAIVVETMTDLAEAVLAVQAARETGLPVVACMTFCAGEAEDLTPTDVTPEQAAEALAAAGAAAIGANCMSGAAAPAVCRRLRAATQLPVWIKPSAGLPEVGDGPAPAIIYPMTPETFAQTAVALVEAGADFVGGCCGTGPDFTRALARALEKKTSPQDETMNRR